MDKSQQQNFECGLTRSPYNNLGSRTRQSSGSSYTPSSRKSFGGIVGLGASGGQYKQNAFSQSRYSASINSRSNLSIPGIRSDFNVVESYGFQLPVLVNEALTFSDKNQNVSVRCSENGWSWVVHGRRLLIWQYKDSCNAGSSSPVSARSLKELRTPQRRNAMSQCRELTLPHCDIGHKATLVSVFFMNEGKQMASCLAVSPTGDVRFWPSIAHDGSSTDVTGILDGQEFDYLLELPKQNGYLLATTTCSLVFLHLQMVNGRHFVQHKTIRQPSGFLEGIGKKFASIIIGNSGANEKENKFIGIICESSTEEEAIVVLLADHWVQRWRIAKNGQEQLVFEDCEILRGIRDEFQHKFWNIRGENIDTEMSLLDMQLCEGKIYVLVGAVNKAHTPQMYYSIAVMSSGAVAMQLLNFIPLKLSQSFNVANARECLCLRFILSRTHFYLYTEKIIYPVNISNPQTFEIDTEKIEFHVPDDRLLSASMCGNQIPIFFSRNHGLLCVTPGDFDSSDVFNMSCNNLPTDMFTQMSDSTLRFGEQTMRDGMNTVNESNLYMFDLDPDTLYNDFKDEVSQLKAAFLYRLKRNNKMCNGIVNELLRNTVEMGSLSDAHQLDKIVISIAEDLAEDIPATDPRWEQVWSENNSNRHALGSSTSLKISTQLQEKNSALRHFVEFLHATGIWEKLHVLASCGGSVLRPTCFSISDIHEKIIAAIALKFVQDDNKSSIKLIDEAITNAVSQWEEKPQGNLKAQDIFYVNLCKFQSIFAGFAEIANKRISAQQQSTLLAKNISDINEIMLHVLGEVLRFRERNAEIYSPPTEHMDPYENLPWTAMSGVCDVLTQLVDFSVRYGARCATEVELKQRLYQQVLELIDIILDARKTYLDSVRETEKYNVVLQQFEAQRSELIKWLIEDLQYEFAAKLAEKYLDFPALVLICDKTDNQERLDLYIKRYEEYDFSQFAINWHLQQNRQGDLFERFKGNQAALTHFMRDHPSLAWVQLVRNGDLERAAKVMLQLAQSETEYVARKKSILSMAKLSTFAAADANLTMQVENINNELLIIEYQEQLSENVLQALGYDVDNQRVLKVEEIINVYISAENESANEQEFRKALELLKFVEPNEKWFELNHKIWCAAILRDNWKDYNTDLAVDYLQDLLFYKLAEFSHLLEQDFEKCLPDLDDLLTSSELGDLVHNSAFAFLLKLTYEYIADSYKKNEDDVMEIEESENNIEASSRQSLATAIED